MKGKIKFYIHDKGYGFITGDDEKDVFVHQSALDEGLRLKEGDSVEYEIETGDRGPKAVNVTVAE